MKSTLRKLLKLLVGARGFEPPTPCSQSRCATRLRHAPNTINLISYFVVRNQENYKEITVGTLASPYLSIDFKGIR